MLVLSPALMSRANTESEILMAKPVKGCLGKLKIKELTFSVSCVDLAALFPTALLSCTLLQPCLKNTGSTESNWEQQPALREEKLPPTLPCG